MTAELNVPCLSLLRKAADKYKDYYYYCYYYHYKSLTAILPLEGSMGATPLFINWQG